MSHSDLPRESQIFLRAVSLDSAGRERILAEACGDDVELRKRVEAILAEHDRPSGELPLEPESKQLWDALLKSVRSAGDETEDGSHIWTVLQALRERGPRGERFERHEEIGLGGFGRILRVHDPDVRRDLAMKILRGTSRDTKNSLDPTRLARFLEEAQVTGQLDHPGILPVHELGLDPNGELYFTMKLVKGKTLATVFAESDDGRGWPRERTVSAILQVCEAVSYAHAKGVIHRDLKPANIMVGRYGEVYVMDWGLARILGRHDPHEELLRSGSIRTDTQVRSDRRDPLEHCHQSPIYTQDGQIVGTPAYMSPEQASGLLEKVDRTSDVYAIGAILYELLTGHPPYCTLGERVSPRMVLARVYQGPPKSIDSFDTQPPPELAAICEKAMSRKRADRYPDTRALADDLRAFLEGRVVSAYQTGAVIELQKWIRRNRGLAATLAAILLLSLALAASVAAIMTTTAKNAQIAEVNEKLTTTNDLLSDLSQMTKLKDRAEQLWPARPDKIEDLTTWIDEAQDLVARRTQYEDALAQLQSTATERDDNQLEHEIALSELGHELRLFQLRIAVTTDDEREGLRVRQAALRGPLEDRLRFYFPDSSEHQWRYDNLYDLVDGLRTFEANGGVIEDVQKRLDYSRSLQKQEQERREAWTKVAADLRGNDHYDRDLVVPFQQDLLYLGPDPESGLLEFWHEQSGDEPLWDKSRGVTPSDTMGIVFVLIPGGTTIMGASAIEGERNFDLEALPEEGPPHEVMLKPYFLAKYEMTQHQWWRLTGTSPSAPANEKAAGRTITRHNPVTDVSWHDCMSVLPRFALSLPTEAQWEHGARSGSDTPYWSGDFSSLSDGERGYANLFDQSARKYGAPRGAVAPVPWDDQHLFHAPVGTYPANDFGLHDVVGNVWEWCKDRYGPYSLPTAPATGERLTLLPEDRADLRVRRGGSFHLSASVARASFRFRSSPYASLMFLGVRPARNLDD